MKHVSILLLLAALAGCSSINGSQFENRIVCTVAKDKSFVVSEYGPVGISSQIADADAKVVCK